jgi:proline iminopeptidase
MVFGGSWGSTLALFYAQTHPEAVGCLVLRGIFTGRKLEFEWSFSTSGVAMLFPDAHETLVNHIPAEERTGSLEEDLPRAYYKRFASSDREVRLAAGKVWNLYELKCSKVDVPASDLEKVDDDEWSLAHGFLESHYFLNGLFMEDGHLLKKENVDKMRKIPGIPLPSALTPA